MKTLFLYPCRKRKIPQSLAVKGLGDDVPGSIRTCDAEIRRTALGTLGCPSDVLQSLSINEFNVSSVYLIPQQIPDLWLRGDAVVTDRYLNRRWDDLERSSNNSPCPHCASAHSARSVHWYYVMPRSLRQPYRVTEKLAYLNVLVRAQL